MEIQAGEGGEGIQAVVGGGGIQAVVGGGETSCNLAERGYKLCS